MWKAVQPARANVAVTGGLSCVPFLTLSSKVSARLSMNQVSLSV
jgi:hypothetical protein